MKTFIAIVSFALFSFFIGNVCLAEPVQAKPTTAEAVKTAEEVVAQIDVVLSSPDAGQLSKEQRGKLLKDRQDLTDLITVAKATDLVSALENFDRSMDRFAEAIKKVAEEKK